MAQLYDGCQFCSSLFLPLLWFVSTCPGACLDQTTPLLCPAVRANCGGETEEKNGGKTKPKRVEREDREAQGYRDGEANAFRKKNWQQNAFI